jgi:hypothetical protein
MSLTAARVAHGDRMSVCTRAVRCAGDIMSMSAAAINSNEVRMIARARTARAVCMSAAAVDSDCVRMCAV